MPKKKEKKSGEHPVEFNKSPSNDDSPIFSGEKEKQVYLTQIRYLTDELERKQLKCEALEKKNKTLLSQYSALEMEKRGITEYLKHCLFEKEEEVEKLLERLEVDEQKSNQSRAVLQLHYDQMNKDLHDQVEDLVEKKETLEKRLASLGEFQKQKDELISNMESLENQLALQQKKHKKEIHCLEMKALVEKRRLKEEIQQQTATMEDEVEQLVEQKLPEASRLVVQENIEVKACFSQLSNRTQILIQENGDLHQHKTQLIAEVDVLEQMLRETSRMNCLQKKMMQQLTDKCQALQTEQKVCQQQIKQLENEKIVAQNQIETLRKERASLFERHNKISEKFSILKTELDQEEKIRITLRGGIQDAGHILRDALMEEPTEQDLDLDFTWWKQQMHKALMILDKHLRASAVGKTRQTKSGNTGGAGEARPGLYPDLNVGFQVSFIPSPYKKYKHIPPRTGTGSFTTVPLYRKPIVPRTSGSLGSRSAIGPYPTKQTAKFK